MKLKILTFLLISAYVELSVAKSVVPVEKNTNVEQKTIIEELKTQRWLETTLSSGFTKVQINKITGADIETNPTIWASVNLALFPDSYNISIGYSKTLNSDAGSNDKIDNSSEQYNLEVPFDMIGLTGFSFLYNKYKFNSYLTAKDNSVIGFVKEGNRDKDRKILMQSRTVYVVKPKDTIAINVESERFELRKYIQNRVDIGEIRYYVSGFKEDLKKPWEDTKLNEVFDYPEDVTIVYGTTKFGSKGLSFGGNIEDYKLKEGFNVKNFGIDLSKLDIQLTKFYSLKDKVKSDIDAYKISGYSELAYRSKTPLFGRYSYLIFSVFGKYDYFFLRNKGNGDNAELSDDFLYGARVAITF